MGGDFSNGFKTLSRHCILLVFGVVAGFTSMAPTTRTCAALVTCSPLGKTAQLYGHEAVTVEVQFYFLVVSKVDSKSRLKLKTESSVKKLTFLKAEVLGPNLGCILASYTGPAIWHLILLEGSDLELNWLWGKSCV